MPTEDRAGAEQIIEHLRRHRQVSFAFLVNAKGNRRSAVRVRFCEEHDLVEYDVEFEPDAYFEVMPADADAVDFVTDRVFRSYAKAGSWLAAQAGARPR